MGFGLVLACLDWLCSDGGVVSGVDLTRWGRCLFTLGGEGRGGEIMDK